MVEKKSRVSVFNKTNILNGKSFLAREGSLYWRREAAKARTCLEAHSVIVTRMSKYDKVRVTKIANGITAVNEDGDIQ